MIIAGIDGCPGGWIMVTHPIGKPDAAAYKLFETFSEAIEYTADFASIAVDMPIGLPKIARPGGRSADRAARSLLGARQSSVFAVPARAAITCTDYRQACETALAYSDPPRKVAKQTFNLFPKIREIDAIITPALQQRLVECHPEVAFWAMNNRTPLAEPKKVKSSPYQPGLALRRRLLEAQGFLPDFLITLDCPRRIAAPDDLLDACACAWTANRLATGQAEHLPPEPDLDGHGLRMEIVY
jgi:predicted RNase H-like nuclease